MQTWTFIYGSCRFATDGESTTMPTSSNTESLMVDSNKLPIRKPRISGGIQKPNLKVRKSRKTSRSNSFGNDKEETRCVGAKLVRINKGNPKRTKTFTGEILHLMGTIIRPNKQFKLNAKITPLAHSYPDRLGWQFLRPAVHESHDRFAPDTKYLKCV